jgi:hypothetical protein
MTSSTEAGKRAKIFRVEGDAWGYPESVPKGDAGYEVSATPVCAGW